LQRRGRTTWSCTCAYPQQRSRRRVTRRAVTTTSWR
jgi:hypothetical protein